MFENYRIRNPENVGIMNGKPYFHWLEAKTLTKIASSNESSANTSGKEKDNVRSGHR